MFIDDEYKNELSSGKHKCRKGMVHYDFYEKQYQYKFDGETTLNTIVEIVETIPIECKIIIGV